MKTMRAAQILSIATLLSVALSVCAATTPADRKEGGTAPRTVHVAGSGVDFLNTAMIHSKETTPTGLIQRSTEIVELTGDLTGRVLYHVTSTFDFAAGTLVNAGDQVYSGTIAGSEPVLIHDDQFRFTVNLTTGEETGQVYLFHHIAGPRVRCALDVTGTGLNGDGNPTFDYSGDCIFLAP